MRIDTANIARPVDSKMRVAANAIADVLTDMPPQSAALWWQDLINVVTIEIEARRAAARGDEQ